MSDMRKVQVTCVLQKDRRSYTSSYLNDRIGCLPVGAFFSTDSATGEHFDFSLVLNQWLTLWIETKLHG